MSHCTDRVLDQLPTSEEDGSDTDFYADDDDTDQPTQTTARTETAYSKSNRTRVLC